MKHLNFLWNPKRIFIVLFCIFIGNSFTMVAQDKTQYFLQIKEGHELGAITKTGNPDSTLTLSKHRWILIASILDFTTLSWFVMA